MNRISRPGILALLAPIVVASLVVAAPSGAQYRTDTIGWQPECRACSVTMEPIVTIAAKSSPGLLFRGTSLARDSRGRYYATSASRTSVIVFDSSGNFVGSVSRAGDGPGEVSGSIRFVAVGTGDSLYILDAGRRLNVFGPRHDHSRMQTLGPLDPVSMAIVNGRVVVSAAVRSGNSIGYAFHSIDASGVIRTFGSQIPATHAEAVSGRNFLFVASNDQLSLWQWDPLHYSIDQWTSDGVRRRSIDVQRAPWLDEQGETGPPRTPANTVLGLRAASGDSRAAAELRAATPPDPGNMRVVAHDSAGLLWIAGYRSDKSLGHDARVGRGILEVLNPATRSVVHSAPMTHNLRPLRGTSMVFEATEDGDGDVILTVWRLRLLGNNRR